jgi:two-component system, NtrC family, sensor kinase
MMISAVGSRGGPVDPEGEKSSFWLKRILAALLLVSAVPFLLLGAGAWFVFRGVAIEQTLGLHRTMARAHAAAIDLYLLEKLHSLEVIARAHTVEELRQPERLREIFDAMAGVHQHGFVDLGVIDQEGRHLAYVGPFDLMDRTYHDAEWFQAVMTRGSMVSDVFLGHRQAPHTVIAVRQPIPRRLVGAQGHPGQPEPLCPGPVPGGGCHG